MPWFDDVGVGMGSVSVHTTSGGGHPPEFYAERIVERLIHIGNDAPQPIRDQALAYRDKMYHVVLHGLKQAIQSDRSYRKE